MAAKRLRDIGEGRGLRQTLRPTLDEMIHRMREADPREIVQGRTGFGELLKFGYHGNLGTTEHDVWSNQGVFVPPTAARIHAIVSDDSNDSASGTGAQSIKVWGIVDGVADSETVATDATDGTTPVNTTKSYTNIFRMRVIASGSNETNVGNITATAAAPDSTVTAHIAADEGNTLQAIYLVPTAQTLMLDSWYIGLQKGGGNAGGVNARLRVKPSGESWTTRDKLGADTDATSHFVREYAYPKEYAGGTWLKVSAVGSTTAMEVFAGFDGVLRAT